MRKLALLTGALLVSGFTFTAQAQIVKQTKGSFEDKFRQLEEVLPTPNVYRAASGAPGHQYWQQKVDYKIQVTLNDETQWLTGAEEITYTNNSPDVLRYVWVQLDQNMFKQESDAFLSQSVGSKDQMSYYGFRQKMAQQTGDWGYNITSVTDNSGDPLPHNIVDTLMRIDLPVPLNPGQTTKFNIGWNHHILEAAKMGGRGGGEYFEEDGNWIYEVAQWYPRMAVYSDTNGWNVKGFLGSGEFTLEFGDFDVEITVPADHIMAATGVLQNPREVLTREQRDRLEDAKTADNPVFIVTGEEALENEKEGTSETKTWHFKAENVRDFAFATSRKFVWDAQGVELPDSGDIVMAMSLYPEIAMPLWDKYSTQAVVHTINVYSKYTFDYPYPVAWSINGPEFGMEYPMISFNGGRPNIHDDGRRTYTKGAKYGHIGVVIHEVGHNWFPMIVDSDERNWTWMDEGLNTYLQSIAKREWEEETFPQNRRDPRDLISYMLSTNQVPIMTQSDSILGFGSNAYGKPSVALNILRETIVGREAFDFAFKEYSRRWMFKHPFPADFFRSLEDASGVDLDWFWRGWFYTTDHVDLSIENVTWAKVDTRNPDIEEPLKREKYLNERVWPGNFNRDGIETVVENKPFLKDFYNEHDDFTVTGKMRKSHEKLVEGLDSWEKELLENGSNIYFVDFSNIGGLVMPVLLDIEYIDGTKEHMRIPAEIWRRNANNVTKAIIREKEVKSIALDPMMETADADISNNNWPRIPTQTRLQLFKGSDARDLMEEVYQDENPKEEEKEEGGN